MIIPVTETERDLFRACTTISLGDGSRTKFWGDNWLQGKTPKVIAPTLFTLARRKNLTEAQVLQEGRWIQGLRKITTTMQIQEFIDLWSMLREIRLEHQPDAIQWRFMPSAKYSTKSAYLVQFLGSCADHDWSSLWAAKAESKCKVFAWFILQSRLWTANRLAKYCADRQTPFASYATPGTSPRYT
jgi:hypothetical protein